MHHKAGLFNVIWSDMAIESTFMRYGHGPGGVMAHKDELPSKLVVTGNDPVPVELNLGIVIRRHDVAVTHEEARHYPDSSCCIFRNEQCSCSCR